MTWSKGWTVPALVTLAGCAAIVAALLLRTLGIHIDENNYLTWAIDAPLGDTATSGKPPAFYVFNFLLYHALPRSPDWLRPMSLPLVYAIANVLALACLARQVTTERRDFPWHFAILLGSPFFVFNSTQVMMETAVLPCLTITMAALWTMDRDGPGWFSNLVVFVAATASVLFKETAAPALFILLVGFWPRSRVRLWPLGLAIVVGLASTRILSIVLHAPDHAYGGFSALLDIDGLRARRHVTGDYAWMWLFYVSPVTVVAVVSRYFRSASRDANDSTLLLLGGLSLAITFAMQLASAQIFPRYAYPGIWVGLVALAFLLLRGPRWIAVTSIVISLLPVATMWGVDSGQMRLWPRFVADEAHHSSWVVLPGVPTWGWLAFAGDHRRNMCLMISNESSEGPGAIDQYFRITTVNPRVFNESQRADYERCDGPKAIIRREYQNGPSTCVATCPTSDSSVAVCALQEIRYASRPGIMTNLTCLP